MRKNFAAYLGGMYRYLSMSSIQSNPIIQCNEILSAV